MRRLRTPFAGWTLLLLAAVATALVASRRGPGLDALLGTEVALRTAGEGPIPESELSEVERLQLRPGQAPEDAFLQAGLEPAQVGAALDALAGAVDVRRLRPSDTFLLFRSRQGDLRRVEYEDGRSDSRVVLERAESGFRASVQQKPVERYLQKVQGTVEDNLYLAMQNAGGDAGLVLNFSDLFAWDFDFATDTRRGDRFEMLVETKVVDGSPGGFGRILSGRYLPAGSQEPLEAFYHAWDGGREAGYYLANGRSVRKFFLKSPLNFRRISSGYTTRRFHPIKKQFRPHLGVDYAAPTGTPVVALGNGRVVFRGWKGGFGRTIQVRHNKTYLTQYGHLSRYAKGIRSGGRVKQGQVIGYVGMSGMATGPHLDFRVLQSGHWVNPLHVKGGESEPLPASQREVFAAEVGQLQELMDRLEPGRSVSLDGGEGPVPALALARLDTPSAS